MERRIDHPGGPLRVREECFLTHDALAQVHAFATQHNVRPELVSNLLAAAVDEDNYRQDVWVGHLAGHNLRFHLARIRVELREISPTPHFS